VDQGGRVVALPGPRAERLGQVDHPGLAFEAEQGEAADGGLGLGPGLFLDREHARVHPVLKRDAIKPRVPGARAEVEADRFLDQDALGLAHGVRAADVGDERPAHVGQDQAELALRVDTADHGALERDQAGAAVAPFRRRRMLRGLGHPESLPCECWRFLYTVIFARVPRVSSGEKPGSAG